MAPQIKSQGFFSPGSAPQQIQAPTPPAPPQVNPYDEFRKQAQLRAGAQQQQAQNAMQRRFAQMGGGPSGARIKMEQDLQRQGADDLSNQIGSINAQEAQANTQANQFQQQFGLEQMKSLAGIDMARRQQLLDEQGQLFNQGQAVAEGPFRMQQDPYEYYMRNINRARDYLNNNQGAGDFTSYYDQLQGLANPMARRLASAQPQQQGVVQKGQVING